MTIGRLSYIMITNMKKLIMFLILIAVTTACSGKHLSFGKKCVEKGDQIVYSYIWLTEEEHPADTETCKKIEKK